MRTEIHLAAGSEFGLLRGVCGLVDPGTGPG